MNNACEYAGIRNALFNTPHDHSQVAVCGVFMVQMMSLRNGLFHDIILIQVFCFVWLYQHVHTLTYKYMYMTLYYNVTRLT